MAIHSPIEARHMGKGNPSAIAITGRALNNRQAMLLKRLPAYSSRVSLPKKSVTLRDLSALTADTGVEFAMFTKQGMRLVIRGDAYHVPVTMEDAEKLASAGYRWSGHTHPGIDRMSTLASDGDHIIRRQFGQRKSVIYNSVGNYEIFEGDV